MSTDHYKTLDILPSASTADIKKAYNQLSLKYHPDKLITEEDKSIDPDGTLYTSIVEAYSTLKDEYKRKTYDREQKEERIARLNEKFKPLSSSSSSSSSSMFSHLGPDAVSRFKPMARPNFNAYNPEVKRFKQSSDSSTSYKVIKGPDEYIRIGVTLEKLWVGGTIKFKVLVKRKALTQGVFKVTSMYMDKEYTVPPRTLIGDIIVFPEEGSEDETSNQKGDLHITLENKQHELFEHKEHQLHITHSCTLMDAINGFTWSFTDLDGEEVEVVQPSLKTSLCVRKIAYRGIWNWCFPNRDYLYIHYEILLQTLTTDQKTFLNSLSTSTSSTKK